MNRRLTIVGTVGLMLAVGTAAMAVALLPEAARLSSRRKSVFARVLLAC